MDAPREQQPEDGLYVFGSRLSQVLNQVAALLEVRVDEYLAPGGLHEILVARGRDLVVGVFLVYQKQPPPMPTHVTLPGASSNPGLSPGCASWASHSTPRSTPPPAGP